MAPSTEVNSGQLIYLAPDGVAHAVRFDTDGTVSHRSRRLTTDTVLSSIVVFGGSILAIGEGSLAFELSRELELVRRVDLAGQARGITAFPKLDPLTGELHILTVAPVGEQAHVVVSAGGLTRTNRLIADAPGRLTDLVVTPEHVVLIGAGFLGTAARSKAAPITWAAVDIAAPAPQFTWVPSSNQSTTTTNKE